VSGDEIFDVVVIGGGGAGLAAAIEARAAGRDVALLEKNDALGGSTAWSIGSITASATPHQLGKGIKDCPADHWRDMAGFNGDLDPRDNPALRRILAEEMPDTFRWLLGHGVRFVGPMPEPPHRKPRMHNVLPNSRSYIAHLGRAAHKAGIAIRCGTRAIDLVKHGERVVAVDCDGVGGRRRYRRAAASCSRRATSPMIRSSKRATWGRRKPRSKASTRQQPAMDRSLRSGSVHASSTVISRSVRNCALSHRDRATRCCCCRHGACSPTSWRGRSSICRARCCVRSS